MLKIKMVDHLYFLQFNLDGLMLFSFAINLIKFKVIKIINLTFFLKIMIINKW